MTFKKIRFVTDSTADIPDELLEKWQIKVVPAYVIYGGNSYADDGAEQQRKAYYDFMRTTTEVPTTAAPSAGDAQQVIADAFKDADHLMIVTAPAKLSGIHNAMRLGAAELPPDSVTLIDSGTITSALGWQVIVGAEVAAETGDVEQVKQAIQRVRAHSTVYAGLDTLDHLRRSGRVSWAVAGIGSLLQIKPMVTLNNGDVEQIARVRTFKRMLDKLAELARAMAPLEQLAFLHTDNPDAVETLKEHLSDILPEYTVTMMVNTALGTHIGPGAVGLAPLSQRWRN